MNIPTLWLLLLALASLMTTLTWVGLRFFCVTEGAVPPRRTSKPPQRMPRSRRTPVPFRFATLLAPVKSPQNLWLGLALLLVGFTVTLTLALSRYIDPPALTGEDLGPTATVGVVLGEEILVPPQPLPPSMFIGTESFDLEHADRDWTKLDAGFRNSILQLFAKMEARGYRMALLEGFRSPERQEMLAAKGACMTRARAGQSRHQQGFAADLAPVRDGRLIISEQDPWAASAYMALGEETAKLGLTWGGDWTMRDLGHVERGARSSSPARQPLS